MLLAGAAAGKLFVDFDIVVSANRSENGARTHASVRENGHVSHDISQSNQTQAKIRPSV
jgi:hypothetical protein